MEATHQASRLATILDLSRLVCSSLDLDEVFQRILAAVHDLSGAEIVSIMLVDEQGDRLRFVAARGLPAEQVDSPSFRVGEGIAGWVALHGAPVHSNNLRDDPRFVPVYTPGDSTLFALPLKVRSRTLGVLNMARARGGELFSAETVQLVEIFASHAAIAIDNAAAATALRYAATRERMTRLVGQAPRAQGAAARVIGQILSALASLVDLAATAVYRPDAEGGYSPLGTWPADQGGAAVAGAPLTGRWGPAHPAAEIAEARDERGTTLQVRLSPGDGPAHWLVLLARQPGHLWRRDERELARFTAGQVAQLLANERLVLQEQQSRALSETLSGLAAACNAMVGQERLLDFILEQLARYIPYDSSGVFIFHDDHYARMVAGRGFGETREGLVVYMGPGSVSWEARQERGAIYLPDVKLSPHWREMPQTGAIRSWIGTPLVVGDRVIGMLTIDKWTPDAFSATDVHVAGLFADHVAVAFNNQLLLREARTRASQLQLLHQLSLRMSAFRAPDDLLNQVARLLQATFGYYQVSVLGLEGDALAVRATCGALGAAEVAQALAACAPGYGVVGDVVRSGETALVNSVVNEPRPCAHPRLGRTAARLVAAIKGDDQVIGAIALESEQIGAFGQDDVYLLEAVAGQTALALEHLSYNEELRRSEERLAQGERLRALGELASGVAHDFNNLLAGILGHAQLLLGEPLPPAVADELRVIERAALDGAASVRRLQSFAQTSVALPMAAVELGEIIAESLAITRPRWRDDTQSRGVELVVSHEPGAVPPFAGDGPALRDMVTNLVLNALDAMPDGGRLHLKTAALGPEASPLGVKTAVLEVSDTGVGMAPEVQARIFDPFFTTKGPRGTGMGLTMVYGIVQRHQGLVSARSEVGHGTTFTVYLPARQAPGAAPPSLPEAPPQGTRAGGRRHVLVVDDDEAVRRVLARQIGRLGHAVAVAGSGEEALALLGAAHFDLICTDLGMPGMSGWELIARARARDGGLRTVLVTGWGEQIDPETARAQGADVVVTKPFDLVRLREVIEELPRRDV